MPVEIARTVSLPPLAELDGYFEAKLGVPGTGILAVVQRGDEPAAWRGWGDRQIHPGQHWRDPDALTVPFWIASISKHFTAYATLQLAERGLIDLDAPACTYLPRLARVSEAVTVRHLLDSRSGLQHDEHFVLLCGSTPEAGLTFRRRLDFIYDKSHLDVPPGSQTFYQATDFTLLGEVVEAVTGMSLDDYAREAVFAPAGMGDSFYGLHYGEAYPRMAGTYRMSHYGALHQYHNNMEVLGDGSVVSTAADMIAWHQHIRRDALAGRWFEQFGAFCEDEDGHGLMYGCGTNRLTVGGTPAYGKGGHSYAHTSGFVRVPEHDLFVLLFSNQPLLGGLGLANDVAAWACEGIGAGRGVAGAALPEGFAGLWVNEETGYLVEIASEERDRPTGRTRAHSLRFGAATASLHAAGEDRMTSWGLYEYEVRRTPEGLAIAFGDNPAMAFSRCRPAAVTAGEFAALEGRYLCPVLDGLVRIRLDDGRAVLQWGPGHAVAQVLPLHQTARDCYMATWTPLDRDTFNDAQSPRYAGAQTYYVKVLRDADGAVAGLSISNCHARDYRYEKLPAFGEAARAQE